MRERRTRSALIQHGHVTQHRKNLRRDAVVEIFHKRFDVVGQAFCDFVRPMSEEKREIIRRQPEAFFAGVGFQVATHGNGESTIGVPVGRCEDYLFAEDVSFDAQGKEFPEALHHHIAVEDYRVAVGHKRQIGTGRCENHARHPHAQHHIYIAVARHLHARRVHHVIKDEDQHRNHRRQAQTTLADDRTERGADEKEEQTRQRQRDALVPFHFVAAEIPDLILHRLTLPIILRRKTLQSRHSVLPRRDQFVFLPRFEQFVETHGVLLEVTHRRQRIFARKRLCAVDLHSGNAVEIGHRARVDEVIDRIDVVVQLPHVLGLRNVGKLIGFQLIEIGIEVKNQLFVVECLAVVGHALRFEDRHVVRLEVLKLLAVPKREAHVHFVGRQLNARRIGEHNLRAVEALIHLIYNGVVEHARFGVFLLDIKVEILHAVEHPFGDFDGRLRYFDRNEQTAERFLRVGGDVILEVVDHKGEGQHQKEDGSHDAHEGNAGRLHRKEFEVLAHVSESDERGQQNGQRQRRGHQAHTHIPHEFAEHNGREPLAHQVVDISPHELHDKHEQTNEESPHKELQELA